MLNDPIDDYLDNLIDDSELEDFLNFIFDEECTPKEDEEDLSFLIDYLGESE